MAYTIVGIRKGESKGRPCWNIAATKEYSAYDQQNSECEGVDVVSEFTYVDFGIHPGDSVEFMYEKGFQGRATLVDVKILSFASGTPFDGKKPEEGKQPEKQPEKK